MNRGGVCGGFEYLSGAIVDEVIGRMPAQAGRESVRDGLSWLSRPVNRGPKRVAGARMSATARNRKSEPSK